MFTYNLVSKLLSFLVVRLQASSDRLHADADRKRKAIDELIAARMRLMEESGKAQALASNLSKLSK